MPGSKFNQIKGKDPIIETFLAKVSKVESGDNPNAKNPNGTAMGLFQFTEGTWKGLNERYGFGYNLEDRKNPEKSANVMRKFTKDNEELITPVLGRDINDADRYMGHFLGAGGARKFFSAYNINPNAPVSAVVSPEALRANKTVFYNKDGSLKTLSGVYDWAQEKMNIKAQPKVYTPTGQIKTEVYKAPDYRLSLVSSPAELQSSTTDYIEPVEETEPQQVVEARQDIAEKNFIQELGNILNPQVTEPIQQQNQEVVLDPSAYDYINIEEYQSGGTVKDNIPSLQPRVIQGGYESPESFMLNYINSPKYLERLVNQGYYNPEQEILNRQKNFSTLETYSQDSVPGLFEKMYNDAMGIPYSEIGTSYNPSTNQLILDESQIEDMGIPSNYVRAHEMGHVEINKVKGDRLNEADRQELLRRLKPKEFIKNTKGDESKLPHDLRPDENKSDLNALRYILKTEGIYDAGKENFNKKHLDKVKDNFFKKRLLKNYKEEDLIWLMNNIAMDNSSKDDVYYAKKGGKIKNRFTR